jgi:hypothetical protein
MLLSFGIAWRSGRRATRSGKPSTTSVAINSRKSRDGVEKSSHAPLVSKIAGPSGMLASPRLLFWKFRPFSTEVTRTFACSSSDVIASFIARVGSSGEGDITSSMRS